MQQTTEQINDVKTFDVKTKTKVLRAIGGLLNKASEPMNPVDAVNNGELIGIDNANVCAIIAKTQEAKRVLWSFVEKDSNKRIPTLDYSQKSGQGAKYSTEYIVKMVKLMDACGESFKISTLFDYPVTFENDHFKVILAPRVEND